MLGKDTEVEKKHCIGDKKRKKWWERSQCCQFHQRDPGEAAPGKHLQVNLEKMSISPRDTGYSLRITHRLLSRTCQHMLLSKCFNSHSERRVAVWVEDVVFIYLYLDPARTINLIPRCALCVAEWSTWNKSPVLLQDKRKGQCFVYLRCEGECGLRSVSHRPCGPSLRFPFPLSSLFFLRLRGCNICKWT